MGDASFGKQTQESGQNYSQQVDIPDFLKPVIYGLTSGISSLGTGLTGLARSGQDLVAPFNPWQTEGQQAAVDVARGGGNFLPTAQDVFMQTAQGLPVSQYNEGFQDLSRYAGGGGANLSPEAMAALTSTASGDYLYGGPAFDKAVQASIEAVTPSLRSTFGNTRGGLSGVLAQENLGRAGINTFAQQYLNERGNMLNAASQLGNFGQQDANRSFEAARQLSNLSDQERGRQLFAAGQLPGIGTAGSDILRMVGGDVQNWEQMARMAPFNAQLQVLQTLLGGLPLPSLFGQSGDQTGWADTGGFNIGWSG